MKRRLFVDVNLVLKYGEDEFKGIDVDDVGWTFAKGEGTWLLSNNEDVAYISMDDMGNYYLYENEDGGTFYNVEYLK